MRAKVAGWMKRAGVASGGATGASRRRVRVVVVVIPTISQYCFGERSLSSAAHRLARRRASSWCRRARSRVISIINYGIKSIIITVILAT
jgi:hypothetical protein